MDVQIQNVAPPSQGGGVVVAEHLDDVPMPCQALGFAVGPLVFDTARWPLGSEQIGVETPAFTAGDDRFGQAVIASS